MESLNFLLFEKIASSLSRQEKLNLKLTSKTCNKKLDLEKDYEEFKLEKVKTCLPCDWDISVPGDDLLIEYTMVYLEASKCVTKVNIEVKGVKWNMIEEDILFESIRNGTSDFFTSLVATYNNHIFRKGEVIFTKSVTKIENNEKTISFSR